MKYSNSIGVAAAIALILFCFVPWVYIQSINTTVTGLNSGTANYGKPGLIHIFFSILSIILFLIPAVWAKTVNAFSGTFNLVWAIRNFIVVTLCQMGECPEKKLGIYAVVILSLIVMIMAFLPRIEVRD